MSWQELTKGRALPWATMALCALAIARSAAAAPTLEEVAKGVNVDASQISVSGISSGGFMAHQFHVAHSDHIMGAGIVAGGPYYCAHGSIAGAVTECMNYETFACGQFSLPLEWCQPLSKYPKEQEDIKRVAQASLAEAKKQSADGNIDKLSHLKKAKIYLFSGTVDAVVPEGVMAAVRRFYLDAGVKQANIGYNSRFPAPHTMVRDGFKPGGDVVGGCEPRPPDGKNSFIDDCEKKAKQGEQDNGCICPIPPVPEAGGEACPPTNKRNLCKDLADVDLAGAILKRIYGKDALRTRVSVLSGDVQAFDQANVFATLGDPSQTSLELASMAEEGYVFIPTTCKDGGSCKLHVAFHGCLQGGETGKKFGLPGNLFSQFAGYNEWADENHIIVLYPQVKENPGFPFNPMGCWDWWGQGYTGKEYHTQRAKQIKAVAQMINILGGKKKLLNVPAGD